MGRRRPDRKNLGGPLILETLQLEGLDGPKLKAYFNRITEQITICKPVNGYVLKVLKWSMVDDGPDTPIVLILPIKKKVNGEQVCGLLFIPFTLYYVGYQRLDGTYRIFLREGGFRRLVNEVEELINYLKPTETVLTVNMGTGYPDLEAVADMRRHEIKLCKDGLMAAIQYLSTENIGKSCPDHEGGRHHLFITQGFSESLRGLPLQKFFVKNFEFGRQTPLELIYYEHIWTLGSNRLLLDVEKAPNFRVCSTKPLEYEELHKMINVLKKHGDEQLSRDPCHPWYKMNSTAMYLHGINEFKDFVGFVKSSAQQILSEIGARLEVRLRKHIFKEHVVFELELRHTDARIWFKNVQLSVSTDSQSFTGQKMVEPIGILGPEISMNTFVTFRKDTAASFGTFRITVSFVEVTAASEEDAVAMDGQEETKMELANFSIVASDYLNKITTLDDFRTQWRSLVDDYELYSFYTFSHDGFRGFIDNFLRTWFSLDLILQANEADPIRTLYLHGECCGVETLVLVDALMTDAEEHRKVAVGITTRTKDPVIGNAMHAMARLAEDKARQAEDKARQAEAEAMAQLAVVMAHQANNEDMEVD